MRRFFTFLLLSISSFPAAFGQLDTLTVCNPDTSFLNSEDLVDPLPFVNDTLGEGFTRAACIGEHYEQLIFVKIPSLIPFGPTVISVTSVRIDSVTGMPPGFAYVCSRPDCAFPTDTVSCILLTGTASETDTIGDYELKIGLSIGTILGDIPVNIPDPQLVNGTYVLKVRSAGDSACLATPVYDAQLKPLSYAVYPNPTSDDVMLEWSSDHSGSGWLEVRDLRGTVLKREPVRFNDGLQRHSIDLDALVPGLYLIGMTSEKTVFWNKTLKQ